MKNLSSGGFVPTLKFSETASVPGIAVSSAIASSIERPFKPTVISSPLRITTNSSPSREFSFVWSGISITRIPSETPSNQRFRGLQLSKFVSPINCIDMHHLQLYPGNPKEPNKLDTVLYAASRPLSVVSHSGCERM